VHGSLLERSAFRASETLLRRTGFCIHKCILFSALARAVGIASRLAFSDVRNHLSTPRLRELVGGDVFCYHAHAEIYLGQRWLQVTPVFNRNLCQLFRTAPLEFDGERSATLQAFDQSGRVTLETVREHGVFAEFPYESCLSAMHSAHPRLAGEARSRAQRNAEETT
jgi:transglutaminase-like putative cysteine protease